MQITEATDAGYVIVTATDRLARDLRIRFNLARKREGRRGWYAPAIFSFRSWIVQQWGSCWPAEQLLYGAQELSLWLYAVESSDRASAIINKTGAARAARSMGRLLERHGATPADLDRPHASDDELAFREWSETVAQKRAARQWITEDALPAALIRALSEGQWTPAEKLLCVGFVERTRQQDQLFQALQARGVVVEFTASLEPAAGQITLHRPPTRADQFRWVAERLRERLQAAGDDPVEVPRCAVLVPDVQQARPMIEAAFREVLAPHVLLAGADADHRPWRFARGEALLAHPMVATVFDVLALEGGTADLATVSRLVLTPWLFGALAPSQRAALDLYLRRAGGTRFSRQRVLDLTKRMAVKHPTNPFPAMFAKWLEQLDALPSEALPSEWADRWSRALGEGLWGAAHGAAELLQDVADGWDEALDAFRAMDTQLRAINHGRAVVWLREILSEQPVQATVDFVQPVQVLGYHDISGMVFDYVVVCDATSTALPGPALSSGFVSVEVLRRLGVVEASPEGMLERATRWLEHLRGTAPLIDVCAPHFDERGAELVPTSMISGWTEASRSAPAAIASTFDQIVSAGVVTVVPTADPVCAVVDPEGEGVRGGTAILKDTVTSPVVSLLRARLGLRAFPVAEDGLDAATQGSAVHRALQLAWDQLKDSQGLRSLSPADQTDLVRACVDTACETEGLISVARFGPGLAQLERSRQYRLLERWLNHERQRALEFRVLGTELEAPTQIGALPLALRIDRVDEVQLPGGATRTLVIDYKTTSAPLSPAAWDPEKLTEPQLPAYATYADLSIAGIPAVDGIAFAQVSEAVCRFVLQANFTDALVIPEGKEAGPGFGHWPELQDAWRTALADIVGVFIGGSADVDRARFAKSRFDSDLAALIRSERGDAGGPPVAA